VTVVADDLQLTDPTEVGVDPDRLARIPAFLDERYLRPGRLPGFILVVHRGGRTVHLSCQGHADVAARRPLEADAIVRIYSMSKPVTSVALMALHEQARFQLDDPVSRFLPGWDQLRVWSDGDPRRYTTTFPEREVRVRDLLTHTAGLTYGFMGRHPVDALYRRHGVGAPDADLATLCDQLAGLPLVFSPGTRWSYSVATDVAGRLVEVLSGQRFDEYLHKRIFEPLGMVDTGFWVPDEQAHRLAANYAIPSLSPFPVPEDASGDDPVAVDDGGEASPYRNRPALLSGGGGLVSTAADYLRFCRMLANGGELDGARVLGPRTVAHMTTNQLPSGGDLASMGQPVFSETSFAGFGFGLGFSVLLNPARADVVGSPGEFAWGGAASTLFWVDPSEELIVIGLTQLMPSSAYPIRRELRSLVYSSLVG
jgi:CubicO group peptidase (beta-lactamase class C family)